MIYLDGNRLVDDTDWKNTVIWNNLIKDSTTWSNSFNLTDTKKNGEKYNGGQILELDGIGSSHGAIYTNTPMHQLVTFSVYAKSDDASFHFEFFGGVGSTTVIVNKSWTRYTFTATHNGPYPNMFLWKDSGTKPLYLALPKMEFGSKATPWSPALEDFATQSDVINLQDQINQLKSKLGG